METIWYVSYAGGKQFFTYEERIAKMARSAGAIILENPTDSSGNPLLGNPTQTISIIVDENGNISYSVITHPDIASAVINSGLPPPIPEGPTSVELLAVRVSTLETINADLQIRINSLETTNANLTNRLDDLEQWALTLTRL
jgi:hypothetical protein